MREEWQFIPDTWVTHRAFCEESKRALEECNLMDERFKVIARLLNGEKMAVLCREFCISAMSPATSQTGYAVRQIGRARASKSQQRALS